MSAEWPLELLSTITFDEKDGKTSITIRWAPINATAAERKLFAASHASMNQGWSGTFEQLENYVNEVQR